MLDLVSKQIIISRDVVIDELKKCDWNNNDKNDLVRIVYEESSSEAKTQIQVDTNKPQVDTNIPQRVRNMTARL